MIILYSAHIKNYRSLRDVAVEFAAEGERNLTVIRAANGTGKTTFVTALTWGLFGDIAFGKGGHARYRVHPIDWGSGEGEAEFCDSEIQIDFGVVDDESGLSNRYSLVRRIREQILNDGGWRPAPLPPEDRELLVFRHSAAGWTPLDNPTAFISNRVLRPALKDIFFIDGDRALTYIEVGDKSAKRDRVSGAVRELLGIELLERAHEHVKRAKSLANDSVKKSRPDSSATRAGDEVARLEGNLAHLRSELATTNDDLLATEARKDKAHQALREALAAGGEDRKQLEHRERDAEHRIHTETNAHREQVTSLRMLLNSPGLVFELSASALRNTLDLLTGMEEQKIIPNTLPDVVRDRLERGTCICGQDVKEGTPGHDTLTHLLEDTEKFDDSHAVLMHLTQVTRGTLRTVDGELRWAQRAQQSMSALLKAGHDREKAERELAEVRAKIRNTGDADIEMLQHAFEREDAEENRLLKEQGAINARLESTQSALRVAEAAYKEARKGEGKLSRAQADFDAATDLLGVIERTMDVLTEDTVQEVSQTMNQLFLKMIMASPEGEGAEGGAIIQKIELTDRFDIRGFGADGRELNPDTDFSGAQKRALTLAFLLSLIQESGVTAPSIVDTPLGMTSGQVRRSILQNALEHSSQLVLFLTADEIKGVEDILDQSEGQTYTFTNATHYPRELVNDPGIELASVLVCACGPRQTCQRCLRRV